MDITALSIVKKSAIAVLSWFNALLVLKSAEIMPFWFLF